MVDATFIKQRYATLADGQLIDLAKKESAGLTAQAFNILKEEFDRRKMDPGIIEEAEQKRLLKQESDAVKVQEGEGEDILKPLYNYAFFDMMHGKTYQEIFEGLMDKGVEEQLALQITEGLELKADKLVKQSSRKIKIGGVFFFVGLAVTFITLANPFNGRYIVMYGFILFGGIALFSGLSNYGTQKKVLQNCIKQRELLESQEKGGNGSTDNKEKMLHEY